MQYIRLSIIPALLSLCLLAGCGGDSGPPPQPNMGDAADNAVEQPVMGPEIPVLAFGDSLFAGYNVALEDSYPSKLEAALRAQGINARITNAGVSGDTTAAGLRRLTFTLDAQKAKPELFILELGGNDLLRGIQPEHTRSNIAAMLAELSKREIPVLLMGIRAPPNYGPDFQAEFNAIHPELAAQYGARLVPFFLEPVYGKPGMMQSDRIHPTEAGIELLVSTTLNPVKAALPNSQK